jgi:hypothetical protein
MEITDKELINLQKQQAIETLEDVLDLLDLEDLDIHRELEFKFLNRLGKDMYAGMDKILNRTRKRIHEAIVYIKEDMDDDLH